MARLNLTLDPDTLGELDRHARAERVRRAAMARALLREALSRRAAVEHRRKLAADYAAGRRDAREALADLEAGQLELLDDEEA